MENEAWFFVGLFFFIFLVWIAVGGPSHPISFSGPTLAFSSASSTATTTGGNYFSLPRSPFGLGDTYISLPGSSNGSYSYPSSSSGGGDTTSTPPPLSGVDYGTPSPYQSVVSMSHYVSGANSSNPGNESIQLSVSSSNQVPVDLTGWTLESEATGKATMITQGSALPTSGIINAVSDIVLLPGEQAIVISGRSPIGASFKENKCVGYFAQFQQFSPSLSTNCPAPSDELQAEYQGSYIRDASCISYVNTLSRCQAVLSPPVNLSGACQSFLVKYLNYNGCVDAHQSDANFDGTAWRIYLGRTDSLFRSSNEVVKLLDKQGNTVDAFTY